MEIDPRRIEVPHQRVAEILRGKTPAERLALVNEMWHAMRSMIQQAVRTDHPEWSNDQVNGEVARRIAGGST